MIKNYKWIPIFLLLLNPRLALAEKVLLGTNELPLELNLIVEYFQNQGQDNYKKILPLILEIDRLARSLKKEDAFIIGKIEIYKSLLKSDGKSTHSPINKVTQEKLKDAQKKTNDKFISWFLQALIKDSQDLLENPLYAEFLLQNTNSVGKNNYSRLAKKANLLQTWISKINPDDESFPENLKNEFLKKILNALNNIKNNYSLMISQTQVPPPLLPLKDETELKFFTIRELPKVKTPSHEEKSVEEILAPITDRLPAPSEENWLQEENTPPELKDLPKPANDADWLQDF